MVLLTNILKLMFSPSKTVTATFYKNLIIPGPYHGLKSLLPAGNCCNFWNK